jgi:hypothetical protein
MDNHITSLKGVLYERISSPLIGSFIVSWSIWNWKFYILLFIGDEDALTRIKIIEETLIIPDKYNCNLIIIPLLFSLAYIYLYPFISKEVYRTYKRYIVSLNIIKNEEEKKRLLTEEESNELRLEMSDLQSSFSKQIKSKDAEIKALRSKIEDMRSYAEVYTETKNPANNEERIKEIFEELKNSKLNPLIDDAYKMVFDAINDKRVKVYLNNNHVNTSDSSRIMNFRDLALSKDIEITLDNDNFLNTTVSSIDWSKIK